MDYHQLLPALRTHFPQLKIEADFPLAPLTTLKIGGPADLFIQTSTNDELIDLFKFLIKNCKLKIENSSITMLGNGSNVLISDHGIRGIVIRNVSKNILIHSSSNPTSDISHLPSDSTHRTENEPQKYLNFQALDYDESDCPTVNVTLDAGVPLPLAINSLIKKGITGLQWFAYIPGTIGGAVWYNIHGGKYHLSDYIDSIQYFDLKNGSVNNFFAHSERSANAEPEGSEHNQKLLTDQAKFAYETSPFQSHPDWLILSATFRLYHGDATKADMVVKAWVDQKAKVQPMNSAGSAFRNPSLADSTRIWGEQKSTGWIIDHELAWKGKTLGGAQISEKHANFIVNANSATAADYYQLAKLVQAEVKKRFDLDLKMEVRLLGEF